MVLQDGNDAPEFELPCCDGDDIEDVRLEDLLEADNVILAFFPLAFSPVCTEELCTFRDMLDELLQLDARVYGISLDNPFALNTFIEREELNFPLLSDFNRDVIEKYSVPEDRVLEVDAVPRRSIFLIDRDGIIQYSWSSEDPFHHPDYDELKKQAQRLS